MSDEVGRVSIRVMPDLKGFRREVERELKRIERSVRGQIRVQIKTDSTQARTEARRAIDAIGDEARKARPNVQLKLDDDAFNRKIREIRSELGKIDIKPELEDREVIRSFQLIEDKMLELERKKLHLGVELPAEDRHAVERDIERLQSEIGDLKAHVSVDLEANALAAKLKAELEKARALRDFEVSLKAKLDNDAFNRSLAYVRSHISDLTIKPDIDSARLESAISNLESKLLRIDALSIKLHTELSAEDRRRVEHELRKLEKDAEDIKATIAVGLGEGSKLTVQARLTALARDRIVKIRPVLDSRAAAGVGTALAALSGGRLLADWADDLWSSLKKIDKQAPIIGTIATAIMGLTGWLGTAASNTFMLAKELAQIGPAALALPGMMGGMALGVTAFVIAIKDINKRVPEFNSAWKSMSATIKDNFWDEAAKPMRKFASEVMPEFARGMGKTATQLGRWTGALAGSLGKIVAPELKGMFADLSKSIEISSQHTDSLAKAMLVLGRVGAGYLPRLAAWTGKLSDGFAKWLLEAEKSGQMGAWIETGIQKMQDLGRVVKFTSLILADLARAAEKAGGQSLAGLADVLSSVRDVTKSGGFQDGAVHFLSGMHESMSEISRVSGPAFKQMLIDLSRAFGDLAPTAGNSIGNMVKGISEGLSSPGFQAGLDNLISGFNQFTISVGPNIKSLGGALGEIGSFAGQLASDFGPLIGHALPVLESMLERVRPGLEKLSGALSKVLDSAMVELGPGLSDFAAAVGDLMGTLGGAIEGNEGRIKRGIASISTALDVATTGIEALAGKDLGGSAAGQRLASDVASGISGGQGPVMTAVSNMIAAITVAWSTGAIGTAAQLAWQGAVLSAYQATEMIKTGVVAMIGVTSQIMLAGFTAMGAVVSSVFNSIVGSVAEMATGMSSAMDQFFHGDFTGGFATLATSFSDGLSMAIDPTQIANTMGTSFSSAMGSVNFGTPFATAASAGISSAMPALGAGMASAGPLLGSSWATAVNGVDYGSPLSNAMSSGVAASFPTMTSSMATAAPSVSAGWMSAVSGADFTTPVATGVSQAGAAAGGAWSSAIGGVDWSSPMASGMTNATAAGGVSLTQGLSVWQAQAATQASGVATAVSTQFAQLPGAISASLSGLLSVVNGSFAGLTSQVGVHAAAAVNAAGAAFSGLGPRVAASLSGVNGAVGAAFAGMAGVIAAHSAGIASTVTARFGVIRPIISAAMSGAVAAVSAGSMAVTSRFTQMSTVVAMLGQMMTSRFVSALRSGIGQSAAAASAISSTVTSNLRSAQGQAHGIGAQISAGMAAGIRGGAGGVAAAARSVAASAMAAARSELSIHSPSRKFRKIGAYAGEGFALGMADWNASAYQSGLDLAKASVAGAESLGTIGSMALDSSLGVNVLADSISGLATNMASLDSMSVTGSATMSAISMAEPLQPAAGSIVGDTYNIDVSARTDASTDDIAYDIMFAARQQAMSKGSDLNI